MVLEMRGHGSEGELTTLNREYMGARRYGIYLRVFVQIDISLARSLRSLVRYRIEHEKVTPAPMYYSVYYVRI